MRDYIVDVKASGRKLRELRGIRTQTGVAKETGLSKQQISDYERGTRRPPDEAKVILAKYYGLGIEDIFFTA